MRSLLGSSIAQVETCSGSLTLHFSHRCASLTASLVLSCRILLLAHPSSPPRTPSSTNQRALLTLSAPIRGYAFAATGHQAAMVQACCASCGGSGCGGGPCARSP